MSLLSTATSAVTSVSFGTTIIQHLGCRDDAAFGMNGHLLHRSCDRRGELRQSRPLLVLGEFLGELLMLERGLRMALAQQTLRFRGVSSAVSLRFHQRRLRLHETRPLRGQVLLLLYALSSPVLPGVARHEALGDQAHEVGLSLSRDGKGGLELGDELTNRRDLGLAARLLGRQLAEPCGDVGPFRL